MSSTKTYNETQEIAQYLVRVSKEDSVFTYFTLEACDNMCFYSTIPHENGQKTRDITISCTIEFENDVDHVIAQLQKRFPLEIVNKEIKKDIA